MTEGAAKSDMGGARERGGLAPFNPFAPEFTADPYRVYARYRAADPVHRGAPALPNSPGTWFLFRFDDVFEALRSPDFVRGSSRTSDGPPLPEEFRPFWEMAGKFMLFQNPPDHTRLRSLVSSAFTPRMVAQLEPRITEIADELLDRVHPLGGMELISAFAYPLPVIVIAELLGVPKEDRHLFREWSGWFGKAIDMRQSPELYRAASEATFEVSAYLKEIIGRRRVDPRDDLLSALIAAEEAGDRLDEQELIATVVLLLVAGHETTANLIGNGTLSLQRDREQWELLCAEPELIPNAVEELIRYDSSVQATFRFAARDLERRGKRIAAGEQVAFLIGSANRDPEQFPEPDRLDVRRNLGRHLGFGMGIHFCLGAPLARLEAKVAFEKLTGRLPALRPASEDARWRDGIALRGLEDLPVLW